LRVFSTPVPGQPRIRSMRRHRFAVVLLFACASLLTFAQQRRVPTEQRSFSVEEQLVKPVLLPSEVLQLLRSTKDQRGEHDVLEQCAQEESLSVSNIPATWFEATELTLKSGEPPGLLVKAKNACLFGAHIGPYWIFRRAATGYQLAFVGRADALHVKKTRTDGYHDLELIFMMEAGRAAAYSKFCYQNGHYEFCGRRTVRQN